MEILQQPAQRIGLSMYYHAEINAQVGSNRAFLQSLSMVAESHGDTPSWGGYTVDFIPPSAVRYREGRSITLSSEPIYRTQEGEKDTIVFAVYIHRPLKWDDPDLGDVADSCKISFWWVSSHRPMRAPEARISWNCA
jgi:hypothetical protein